MKLLPKNSLRLRLISILSLTALIIWGISTSIAWFEARKEVNELFDAQQILLAKRLATSNLHQILIERQMRGGFRPYHKRKAHYDDDALAFAVFTRNGELLLGDDAKGENFIFAPVRGFSVTNLAGGDDKWRIFWLPSEDRSLIVAVGQQLKYRGSLINDMVFKQMWVWIAGLPLLIGLMILLIGRELKNINQVGQQMRQRSPDDHQHFDTKNLPDEILPLVQGLNGFFDRTSTMLVRERRFTSDAAHELRSPLAGLRIQTEIAQMVGDDAKLRDEALNNLTQGIDRATQVIEQLLTLSRLDNLQQLDELEIIDWQKLISSVISELYFSAQRKQIELLFDVHSIPVQQQGQTLLLSLMLRNVLDNAIKYCPENSQVKVRLEKTAIYIEDNGGGVNQADLDKLGQRFYRPAGQNEKGSGLGLSIVKRIAELHHIKVQFENRQDLAHKNAGLRIIFQLTR
ncbi:MULTISPECIES: quorum sensing histidine kinase QseC [unclassified Lonepinella]|uniref:quorum sensing histidine kinase QseC n=1 Tax=unclassified Lonepinella TaxID=2642006 RepID=UPI0036DD3EAB